jgi:hypothetical protein
MMHPAREGAAAQTMRGLSALAHDASYFDVAR